MTENNMRFAIYIAIITVVLLEAPSFLPAAYAADPRTILARFETEAAAADPGFKADVVRGEDFFRRERTNSKGKIVSCTGCHTRNPKAVGETRAHKKIKPLAPVANPERFTDPKKVAKWFRRNCDDVLERECTAAEKADFIAFLLSVQ